jgi:hypothetical protein
MFRRFLLFSALVFLFAIPARATNAVFIAATSSGANDGSSCANAKALSYFNTSGNWSGSPTGIQIGPDTTVHLCGTFTASAGANSYLQFQGSGTSGHPIILKWETGAIVQAPYFAFTNGGLDLNGKSFITIDGGTNGILQNTANGTGLTYQQDTALIAGLGNSVTITNLSMLNVYQHTIGDNAGGGTQGFAFAVYVPSASNLTVGPNNSFTQCNVCVKYGFEGGEHDLIITGNNFSLSNQAIEMGPDNVGVKVMTNVQVDHNTYTPSRNWDNTLNYYHHNFFHPFTNTAGSSFTGSLQVFDNTASGDMGQHSTSMIFIENNNGGGGGSMGPWYIFNNTFNKTNSDSPSGSGVVALMSPNGFFLNNTIVQPNSNGANSWTSLNFYGGATGWTVKNNIFSGGETQIGVQNPATLTADDNVYYGSITADGNSFAYHSTYTSSISTWRTACACDASSTTANPQLTSSLGIGAGSSAINLGANLTSLSITPLDSDLIGVARPGSGAWTSGAYVGGGGGGVAALTVSGTSANLVAFGSQNTGTTSGASVVTVTSSGTGTTIVSPTTPPYTITGSNPGDFSVSAATCTPSLSMATTTTCTVSVKFTPSTAGARSARLNILSNASGSNFADLTGTGATPGGSTNLIDASRQLKNIARIVNGGTGLGAVAAHQVFVGTASNVFTAKTIPDCTDTAGNHINYTQSTDLFSCGTSGASSGTTTIASGTSALGTSAITAAACATVVTTSATGTATTDNIMADFNADPTSTTGYVAGAMLTIIKYPTTNNVNFKVCNNTASSITPGAVTLNWRVTR